MTTQNKVIEGDCIEELKKLKDGSIDCIITSPPYWKGFAYEAYFNSYAQYIRWTKKWLIECKRVLKPTGTLWLNVINDSEVTTRAFEILNIATEELMYKLHDTIIWYRFNQQPCNSNRQLTNQVEYVFMLRHTSAGVDLNKEEAYNKNPTIFKTKNVGNVWEIPFNQGNKVSKNDFGRKETKSQYGHGGFPIALPETCLLLSTKEDEVVLDCFAGTGTTGLAAKNNNRQYILIEKQKEYVDLMKERGL
jgi:DNA modification methylase